MNDMLADLHGRDNNHSSALVEWIGDLFAARCDSSRRHTAETELDDSVPSR